MRTKRKIKSKRMKVSQRVEGPGVADRSQIEGIVDLEDFKSKKLDHLRMQKGPFMNAESNELYSKMQEMEFKLYSIEGKTNFLYFRGHSQLYCVFRAPRSFSLVISLLVVIFKNLTIFA